MKKDTEIVYGSYYFECNAEDYDAIRERIIQWATKEKYDLDLHTDDDAVTFFGKLGMGEGICLDEDEGFTLEGNLDCEKLNYPFVQLLKILAPYISNEDIGQIVTNEKGMLEIKNQNGKVSFFSEDLEHE